MSVQLALRTDVAQSLGLAIVASSTAPILLLDGDLVVLAVSASFCGMFHIDHDSIVGATISAIGGGEWGGPQLDTLLLATASGAAEVEEYRMDLKRLDAPTRHLVLTARKLDYALHDTRVMLTVSDVTDIWAAGKINDELVRDNAVLLQELQHRVANSLQIIASVLMQSARKVTSSESRAHLTDAHSRVMSVAALQRQLASTATGTVALRPYFTDLCRSIGASMIADRDQLTLTLASDESVTSADVSVSLGLIVTELVINALKHAFPNHRRGGIKVEYASAGDDWKLTVSDDGVGMPGEPVEADAGLGTTIVQALAKKLRAKVQTHGTDAGTTVTIEHKGRANVIPLQKIPS